MFGIVESLQGGPKFTSTSLKTVSNGNDANVTQTLPDGPLQGVKVLELARGITGPMAAVIFADMGADVIKVRISTAAFRSQFRSLIR